jgi:hypothetical protein
LELRCADNQAGRDQLQDSVGNEDTRFQGIPDWDVLLYFASSFPAMNDRFRSDDVIQSKDPGVRIQPKAVNRKSALTGSTWFRLSASYR